MYSYLWILWFITRDRNTVRLQSYCLKRKIDCDFDLANFFFWTFYREAEGLMRLNIDHSFKFLLCFKGIVFQFFGNKRNFTHNDLAYENIWTINSRFLRIFHLITLNNDTVQNFVTWKWKNYPAFPSGDKNLL